MKKLLLWDIDSTLIDSGGAGERGLIRALKAEFGIDDRLHWLDYSGRTDFWIAKAILEHHFGQASPVAIRAYLDSYLRLLSQELAKSNARVLPGIEQTVARAAAAPDIAQGLLTGNLKAGAEIKLRHLGLWSFFPFGAFADDAEDRNHLGPFAVSRAKIHAGCSFAPETVVVIGDTPHDIACGKSIGAKTVAVATGRFPLATLEQYHPTAALADLSRTNAFWEFLQ